MILSNVAFPNNGLLDKSQDTSLDRSFITTLDIELLLIWRFTGLLITIEPDIRLLLIIISRKFGVRD